MLRAHLSLRARKPPLCARDPAEFVQLPICCLSPCVCLLSSQRDPGCLTDVLHRYSMSAFMPAAVRAVWGDLLAQAGITEPPPSLTESQERECACGASVCACACV